MTRAAVAAVITANMLACLVVPLFPLAARFRAEPELKSEAVAVTEGNGPAACIVAASRVARRLGVKAGMTLPQARALLPKLVARGRDAAAERAAQEALLDVAGLFSPRVEETAEGVATLDVDGLERHFPKLRDLGLALLAAAGKEGLPARAGIAPSRLAARIAALLPDSPVVVPPGKEAAFLAPLPLAKLGPQLEVLTTLQRWGLTTVGELANLRAADVGSRLGEAGHALHQMARGLDPAPLVPRRPPPEFREGLRLEWPLGTLEPFLALSQAALERLVRRLEAQAVGCARLDVALQLEPDGEDARSLSLPAPTRDVKTLLNLVRLSLEARPPGAAVVGFTFVAHADQPRKGQLTLFGAPELSPDRLATTLAKLFTLLGEGRAGSPALVNAHRPERLALIPFSPPPTPNAPLPPASAAAAHARGLLAVRVIRPPLPLEVLATDETDRPDAPPRLSSLRTKHEQAGGKTQINGPVRVASGPWHLEEGWWTDAPVDREYWDVELTAGGLYRIYRDAKSGDWFADGVYD